MSDIYRPTWAEIDLKAINNNFNYVQSLNPNKTIIPVIKADAYGHGAISVMQYLYNKGIKMFAVSLLEEAIELRNENKDIKILVMGPILEDQFEVAAKHNISVTLYSREITLKLLKTNFNIKIHMKVDTGMNRYGLKDKADIIELVNLCQAHETIHLEGIFTHFATANVDKKLFDIQVDRFKDVLNDIKNKPEMIHLSNSGSAINYENQFDFSTHIRLGISLYGLSLGESNINLTPAMSLKSKVIQIKALKAKEFVGYSATYQALRDEKIAILPIGYGDGWLKSNRDNQVEINNKRYQIVGVICMGATFVSIDNAVKLGDEVTLFGGLITIDEVAQKQNTIVYEVCTNISKRVPRVYLKGES